MAEVNGKVIKKTGGRVGEGRPVAVDWALSKEKWQEAQKKDVAENVAEEVVEKVMGEGPGSSAESNEDSSSDSTGSNDDSTHEEDGSKSVDEDGSKSVDEEERVDEEEPVRPHLPSVDVGSTLFIRNLPFETTEQELNSLYVQSRYSRIC